MKRVRAVLMLSLVYAAVFVVVQGLVNVAVHPWAPTEFPTLGEFFSGRFRGAPLAAIFGLLLGAQLMFQLSIMGKMRRSVSMSFLVRNSAFAGLMLGLILANARRMSESAPHSWLSYAAAVGTYVAVAVVATAIIAWFGITPRAGNTSLPGDDARAELRRSRELVLNAGIPDGRPMRLQVVPKRLWAWLTRSRSS